jgi:3-hydroxybutyryl-CoA dehydrogenase
MVKKITTKSTKVEKEGTKIHIVGDSPLVEEYAELCASNGYVVSVEWNNAPKPLPAFSSAAIKPSTAINSKTSVGIELTLDDTEQKRNNVVKLDSALPATAPILSLSVTISATEQSSWVKEKHRLVGIGALPSFSKHTIVEAAPTVYTPKETVDVVQRFFHSLGKEVEVVQDRVGMVLPRILCQLVNEAAFAVQEDVATPQDIDTAMKLGTNYPVGPFEWASTVGFRTVYSVLNAIEHDLHEERYRVSPLLKMLAQTGEWWKKE